MFIFLFYFTVWYGTSAEFTLAWMAARSLSIPLSLLCRVMTPARSLPSSSVDSITLAFSWIQLCTHKHKISHPTTYCHKAAYQNLNLHNLQWFHCTQYGSSEDHGKCWSLPSSGQQDLASCSSYNKCKDFQLIPQHSTTNKHCLYLWQAFHFKNNWALIRLYFSLHWPSIKLILPTNNFCSSWVFDLQQLTGQLVDNSHLGGSSIHLMLETVKAVLHDGNLFNVISDDHGGQEFLLFSKKK